jgi:hypothetical protein
MRSSSAKRLHRSADADAFLKLVHLHTLGYAVARLTMPLLSVVPLVRRESIAFPMPTDVRQPVR